MYKKLLPVEITLRYRRIEQEPLIVKNSTDVYNILKGFFPNHMIQSHEQFVVVYFNAAKKLLGVYVMSKGGIGHTVVDIRLILAVALKSLATEIIVAHNHPSGNLKPSYSDECITNRLKEATRIMDIKLIDHLILSDKGFFSFADEGLL